jgi:aspartokinase/homoserine dehydrogenase 1
LFIIGTGLIGKTLLSQIDSQRDYLLEHSGIDIRIAGVANSRYMMFNREGLEISSILNELPNGDTSSVEFFISRMTELNLPNSIFIDNTANAIIPIFYEKILQKNISIVTPNKVAASSSYDRYRSLNLLAKQKNIQFLYETNVGAGLPILSTIKALNDSGDRIQKIEAVLSGSLSFIFNNYDGSTDFSLLVNQAKEKGYTEPDPREDLNGKDVMRKIVILTREAGYPVELDDVVLSSFLPESCFNVDSVEEFFIELSTQDGAMLSLLNVARENNAKLRFIAAMESGKCQVSLHQVSEESPFYGLTSSDNMVVIYTDRYCDNPLVIRGPGAGAQVTAAGVFSDVIYITKTL